MSDYYRKQTTSNTELGERRRKGGGWDRLVQHGDQLCEINVYSSRFVDLNSRQSNSLCVIPTLNSGPSSFSLSLAFFSRFLIIIYPYPFFAGDEAIRQERVHIYPPGLLLFLKDWEFSKHWQWSKTRIGKWKESGRRRHLRRNVLRRGREKILSHEMPQFYEGWIFLNNSSF